MTRSTNDEIRTSTDADFKTIADWLRDEDRQGVADSFYCNLDAIESSHQKGQLLVYVDGTTGLPVAFQLGGLIYPGILEVKHGMRGRGIGTKLVEHCVERARASSESLFDGRLSADRCSEEGRTQLNGHFYSAFEGIL